jgi:tetratricopeptide (TPR) repeat protein
MLARQYSIMNNLEIAQDYYQKDLQMNPDYKKGLIEYAQFLLKEEKHGQGKETEKALNVLKASLRLNENQPQIKTSVFARLWALFGGISSNSFTENPYSCPLFNRKKPSKASGNQDTKDHISGRCLLWFSLLCP